MICYHIISNSISQNPATGKFLADIYVAEQDDIDRAVSAAEKAQVAWARVPARRRSAIVRKFASLMDENKQ